MKGPPATLVIVAGGKASRLGGVAKGLLRVGGRTCLERLVGLGALFEEMLLVGAPVPHGYSNLRTVADAVVDRGAPGGVYSGLAAARSPWVVAVGWDMPFVTAPVVERLLAERDPALDAVCFEVSGRREPLLAAYRAGAASIWRSALVEAPSFLEVHSLLRIRVLPEARLREVDPEARAAVSLNAPDDLVRWAVEMPRG